ncbi:putative methyltransferase-domain-containing protein [Jimgerdemannia flammicorona]|uniref:Putative methyltransferase-domain-containing protein n=2 Tax=Jimgerdemannia flammicorona TaxID=994334 RepID=A0A433QUP8_9FUNG|nr:putative methyltransferase-domain-containing protein [Jimgerdemannia flammicorona]RUS33478.1 putative methyltransferase-domain-containing protein [Jimgerdemannia flammicorona]
MHSKHHTTTLTPAASPPDPDDDDDDFVSKLHSQFALYRLVLHRPVCPKVCPNQWHRVTLLLSNELGLFRKKDLEPDGFVRLRCAFLPRVGDNDGDDAYTVEARPLQDEVWALNDVVGMKWPGFKGSAKGGLEYRIVRRKSWVAVKGAAVEAGGGCHVAREVNARTNGNRNGRVPTSTVPPPALGQRYLHIFPDPEAEHSINVMPLVIGPLSIVADDGGDDSGGSPPAAEVPGLPTTSVPIRFWDADESLHETYRTFPLPDFPTSTGSHRKRAGGRHLLIQESWDSGIPGKVWDSALVLSAFFANMIARSPKWLEGKHVVDLSAGTGFVGLYLASLATALPHPSFASATTTRKTPHITITDLSHALRLIRTNLRLNSHLITNPTPSARVDIRRLEWGHAADARRLVPCDVIIASDVLYETQHFANLVATLVTLSSIRWTRVYLGYKRRGLGRADEEKFFNMCAERFDIRVIGGESALGEGMGVGTMASVDEENALVPELAARTGVVLYRMIRRS